MPIYYLATRPETVVSIVQVGHLPDALPDWLPKYLEFFPNIQNALATTTTHVRQTFILQCDLPALSETDLLTEVHDQTSDTISLRATQMNTEWIEKIYVSSLTEEKSLSNLFNRQCPKTIELNSDLFSPGASPSEIKSFDSKATIPQQPHVTYIKKGDLLGSTMQTLINTVNCVGVMGKGIAFAFKQRYPLMFKAYQTRCANNQVQLGKPYLYKVNETRWILNFPTKDHWRQNSKLKDIENGLKYLAEQAQDWGITSLAIPPLGCGNGGLNWEDVLPLILRHLVPLNIPLEIYRPFESSSKRTRPEAFPLESLFFKTAQKEPRISPPEEKRLSTPSQTHYKM